jgi:hypothetical protein
MKSNRTRLLSGSVASGVILAALAAAGPGAAQTATPPSGQTAAPASSAQDGSVAQVEEVVVTGYRQSLRRALDTKRNSNVIVDEINAEDIADFPDANLTESLQLDFGAGSGRRLHPGAPERP